MFFRSQFSMLFDKTKLEAQISPKKNPHNICGYAANKYSTIFDNKTRLVSMPMASVSKKLPLIKRQAALIPWVNNTFTAAGPSLLKLPINSC